jgi:hypothetical protein
MGTDRGRRAADRSRTAGARASELEERLARLRAGERTRATDIARASEAAEQALASSTRALEDASRAHTRAATAHRAAAVAMDAAGQPDRAADHRRLADAADAAAAADLPAEVPAEHPVEQSPGEGT